MPQDTAEVATNRVVWNQQTSAEARKKSLRTRRDNARRPAKAQALDIQHALHFACKLLKQDLPECEEREERARVASALASVAKGWQSMTDQLRILAGKPLPGSRRPAPDQPKKPKAQSAPKLALPAPESVSNPDSQV